MTYSDLPRAYIASPEKRENPQFPTLEKRTGKNNPVRPDQFVRIFEACVEGAVYSLTYVPPGFDYSSSEEKECQLQVNVRSDVFPGNGADVMSEDPVAAVIKLKEGCLPQLEHWAEQLALMTLEAKKSIRRERVICETWFSFTLGTSIYLFAYMQPCHFLPEAEKGSLPLEVDAIHGKFKQTWDKTIKIPVRLLA